MDHALAVSVGSYRQLRSSLQSGHVAVINNPNLRKEYRAFSSLITTGGVGEVTSQVIMGPRFLQYRTRIVWQQQPRLCSVPFYLQPDLHGVEGLMVESVFGIGEKHRMRQSLRQVATPWQETGVARTQSRLRSGHVVRIYIVDTYANGGLEP